MSYEFRIRAVTQQPNTDGTSSAHFLESDWVTFSGTPGTVAPPTGLTVTPGNAKLDLTWTGSVGATGYDVHYTSTTPTDPNDPSVDVGSDPAAGWVAVTRGGTTASQTISSLVNGTEYKVRVRAKSAAGAGAWVFGAGKPGGLAAPTGLTVTPGNAKLDLTWTGSAGATGYDVHYTSADENTVGNSAAASGSNPASAWVAVTRNGATPSQTISSLSNGTLYRVRVRAKTSSASSPWVFGRDEPNGPVWQATLTPAAFSAGSLAGFGCISKSQCDSQISPSNSFRIGGTDYHFTLGADVNTGSPNLFQAQLNTAPNEALRAYKFCVGTQEYSFADDFSDAAVTSQSDPGWAVNTPVQLQIAPKCAAQTQTPTPTVSVPAAPTGLTVTPGYANLDLTWTAPSGTLTGYDVHYTSSIAVGNGAAASGSNPATAWVAVTRSGATASQTISSLSNGTLYRVRVRAVNAGGDGAWVFGTGTPAAGLNAAAPTGLTVTPGAEQLDVSWDVPPSGTVGAYEVQYTSASSATVSNAVTGDIDETDPAAGWVVALSSVDASTTPSHTITGLTNGTAYRVRVSYFLSDLTGSHWAYATGTPRPVSTDATLSGVTASGSTSNTGTFTAVPLAPSFRANRLAYEATVASSVTHVKLTPTATSSGATVEVGKGSTLATVTSGSASAAIAVSAGANAITVKVTAEDGSTTETYTVTVTRQAAQGSRLTGLSMTAGGNAVTLSPAFATGKHWYKAVVPAGTASVSVTPTWTETLDVSASSISLDTNRPVTNSGAIASSGTAKSLDLATSGITRVAVRAAPSTGSDPTGTYVIDVTRLPAAPTGLTFTPGDTQLSLTWVKPAGPVTGYDVHYTSADAATAGNDAAVQTSGSATAATGWLAVTRSGTVTAQTFSDLTNDIPYRVRVRAKNADGDGAWAFGTGTPVGTPTVSISPVLLETVEGGSSVVVTLTVAPVLATASRVRLVLNDPAAPGRLRDLPRTIDLPAGTGSIEVDLAANIPVDNDVNDDDGGAPLRLEAVNNAPYVLGSPKVLTLFVPDNEPPAAPAGLSLAPGSRKLTASWTKPAGPVTHYELRHKQASAADQDATTAGDPSTGWVTITLRQPNTQAEAPTTTEITGLAGETAYQAQVRAHDGQTDAGNGWGDWSAVQTATTPVSVTRTPDPDLLTGLTVHDGMRALYLDANRDDNLTGLGGPDAIYTVQVNPGIDSVAVTLAWTNAAITGVTGNVRYHDSARSDGGTLTWSSSGATVTLDMQSPLGGPGHPLLTLTLVGVTSQPYRIFFQQNFDWKNANDRLGRILMSIPSSGQGAGQ